MGEKEPNFRRVNTVPRYEFVNTADQLPAVYAAIDRSLELSIDTEADNLFRYRTHLCLLQLLADNKIFLIDLLADLPLEDLWPRLESHNLIMHGSDYDLRLLWARCEFRPKYLFDTMFAAQLLSIPRFGLGSLLEQHFGVILDKDNQRANWSQRPLGRDLLDYAALDVYHLPALRDLLRDQLVNLGRLPWLEQRCQWQILAARDGFPGPDENSWRIGGAEKLRGRGLSVLNAVWHWRESWAEKINTPPFKVTSNDMMRRIALAAEDGLPINQVLQVHLGRRHDRLFGSLAEAVKTGLATDPGSLPRRERRRDYAPMNPDELARQDRLKADRDRLAKGLELDPTLVATRTQLMQIARDPMVIDGVLLPWQAEMLKAEPAWKS